ncbi:MAG: hypothetical protein QM718_11645 [Steroidobacteraceae bacterium]
MTARPAQWLLAAAGLVVCTAPPWAAQPLPGDDLLEFLGSVGGEEDGWTDYLEQTDLDKVAARRGQADQGAAKKVTPVPVKPAPPPQQVRGS